MLIYQETGSYAGAHLCTSYCGRKPDISYPAYTQVPCSGSKPLTNSSVANKVAEVFKDEIEEAERRNTLPPA